MTVIIEDTACGNFYDYDYENHSNCKFIVYPENSINFPNKSSGYISYWSMTFDKAYQHNSHGNAKAHYSEEYLENAIIMNKYSQQPNLY